MSTIRMLAEELQLSRVTVSAALRGLPWVKLTTRERILRHAEERGYVSLAGAGAFLGVVCILRIKGVGQRGRAAVERHRVITRGVREVAYELGYGVEESVADLDDLGNFDQMTKDAGHCGMIILPVSNDDLLQRSRLPEVPCVYTDIPSDALGLDSVFPDYHQGMFLSLARLRASGFRRTGLMLDNQLSLPVRERLLSAYGFAFASGGAPPPPPLFTPVRSLDVSSSWMRRHSFDSLLTTDTEHSRRVASEFALPVFGLAAEPRPGESGLNLNLCEVGRGAMDKLHNLHVGSGRSFSSSCALVATSWVVCDQVDGGRREPVASTVAGDVARAVAEAETVLRLERAAR